MNHEKNACYYERHLAVPQGLPLAEARRILDAAAADVNLADAVENAVPDGAWSGRVVLDNLRAAGFDVVVVSA